LLISKHPFNEVVLPYITVFICKYLLSFGHPDNYREELTPDKSGQAMAIRQLADCPVCHNENFAMDVSSF
jgi:hypothetical protein